MHVSVNQEGSPPMSVWIEFGKLLKSRRCAAILSRAKLARLAFLSEATIKNTERGRAASQKTMLALYAVHELRLSQTDFPENAELKAMTHDLFQRFQLSQVSCSVAHKAFGEVLAWSMQQVQTDAITALQCWTEEKMRTVERQRRRLEGGNLPGAELTNTD